MNKLMVAVLAAASLSAMAAENKEAQELESQTPPIFSFYANFGYYSGYQLYGSLLNKDPVLQGYAEIRAKLLFDDLDLGSLGVGVWHNSDLTGRRSDNGWRGECAISRRAFNEVDPNLSWDINFWFDDEKTIGLYYKMNFVWYWYPHFRYSGDHAQYTTMDWNHYVELKNPVLIPYANFVHEYHESNGNLIQFGVKRSFTFEDLPGLRVTPILEGVWRNRNYCWCFSNYGIDPATGDKIGSGLATAKAELDIDWWFADNFGLFFKIAYCTTLDPNLRDAASAVDNSRSGGNVYGATKDFVWGGVGLQVAF